MLPQIVSFKSSPQGEGRQLFPDQNYFAWRQIRFPKKCAT